MNVHLTDKENYFTREKEIFEYNESDKHRQT